MVGAGGAAAPAGEKVAIKKITRAFDSTIEATRAYREAALLRQLRHVNVVGLRGVMLPSAGASGHLRDLYLVYDLMDTDLHKIVVSKQPLSDEHFRFFLYQVRALARRSGSPRLPATEAAAAFNFLEKVAWLLLWLPPSPALPSLAPARARLLHPLMMARPKVAAVRTTSRVESTHTEHN